MQTYEIKKAQQLVMQALRPMLEISLEDARVITEAEAKVKLAKNELDTYVNNVARQIYDRHMSNR